MDRQRRDSFGSEGHGQRRPRRDSFRSEDGEGREESYGASGSGRWEGRGGGRSDRGSGRGGRSGYGGGRDHGGGRDDAGGWDQRGGRDRGGGRDDGGGWNQGGGSDRGGGRDYGGGWDEGGGRDRGGGWNQGEGSDRGGRRDYRGGRDDGGGWDQGGGSDRGGRRDYQGGRDDGGGWDQRGGRDRGGGRDYRGRRGDGGGRDYRGGRDDGGGWGQGGGRDYRGGRDRGGGRDSGWGRDRGGGSDRGGEGGEFDDEAGWDHIRGGDEASGSDRGEATIEGDRASGVDVGATGGSGGGDNQERGDEGGNDRGRGGRGGGRGRGRGDGRLARRERREAAFDLVVSRPGWGEEKMMRKQAVLGNARERRLQANYFKVNCKPDWAIYHYRVDFKPEEENTRTKKKLLRVHTKDLGTYVFDGSSLFVTTRLTPDPMVLYSSLDDNSGNKIELTVKLVAELQPTDVQYLQIFNIIVRKCLEGMGLEEMGRHFYDHRQAVRIDAHRLELWPGYITTMRNHENDILLGVEITHKVLRLDSCHQVMMGLRGQRDAKTRIREELVGTIVMTVYNRKTYRVDDIAWDTTPSSTFKMGDREITFIEYFETRYKIKIGDTKQPLLLSRPKKKDLHRGMTGPILLIPELCKMTGMTDQMRSNFNLMKALATHLHTDPARRTEKLTDFIDKMTDIPDIQTELQRWGLTFNNSLVEFQGHVIPKETILFGNGASEVPDDKYDWSKAFRSKTLLSTCDLKDWVVIVPGRDSRAVDKLVNSMQRVGGPLRFNINRPLDVRQIGGTRPSDYAQAVDSVVNEYQNGLQMIFVILPRQVTDIYAAVKKRACQEFGIPSQCFVAKNAYNERGLMSICTKVVVQMNAKLGGEPWTVQMPLKNLMVVGFDVYHCGKRTGSSVGAMVATTSPDHGRYYSTVSYHGSKEDLSSKMGEDFTKCLNAYYSVNKTLPDRIVMYRDGVGEGHLKYVKETELEEIQKQIKSIYEKAGRSQPKFTFVVVTKKINTRIFAADSGRPQNPEPGTIADDVITLPERYDFFLVSQFTRQGTVSPVSYNVLSDNSGLDPDKLQRLTFKLCHLYFNWSGTVTVPAPCQYAHKLAYLTGLALGGPSHEKLSHLLYYL